MDTGFVKMINATKGFGFIAPNDATQPDVFFHFSSLKRGLELTDALVRQRVQYELGIERGRTKAVAVYPENN